MQLGSLTKAALSGWCCMDLGPFFVWPTAVAAQQVSLDHAHFARMPCCCQGVLGRQGYYAGGRRWAAVGRFHHDVAVLRRDKDLRIGFSRWQPRQRRALAVGGGVIGYQDAENLGKCGGGCG